MTLPTHPSASPRNHAGPPPGWLAVVYMGLFLAGLYPITCLVTSHLPIRRTFRCSDLPASQPR